LKFEALPAKYQKIFSDFAENYSNIVGKEEGLRVFSKFAEALALLEKNKPHFDHFHRKVRSPFDFYALGLDLFRPIVNLDQSLLIGKEHIETIEELCKNKENVFLFANHQSEADPQLISLLLEKQFGALAEEMIFVAGERVITDPLAIPMSMGRNLLCIYSKKYFDIHKDRRLQMQEHNKKSIQVLGSLLDQGGACIYIAPSGGRDRPDKNAVFQVAEFDPQSIQLCRLLGSKSKQKTHFFPLALNTHGVLPPPDGLQVELGEKRKINRSAIGAAFGKEISFPEFGTQDKEERKTLGAKYVCQLVKNLYEQLYLD